MSLHLIIHFKIHVASLGKIDDFFSVNENDTCDIKNSQKSTCKISHKILNHFGKINDILI